MNRQTGNIDIYSIGKSADKTAAAIALAITLLVHLGLYFAAPSAFLNFSAAHKSEPDDELKLEILPPKIIKKIPDFVRNYPALVDNNGQKCGWDIHLTWYGLPTKFERIKKPKAGAKEGEVEIVYFDMAEKSRKCKSRKMIILDKRGNPQPTKVLKTILAKLGA